MFILREVFEAVISSLVIFAILIVATRVIGKKLLGQLMVSTEIIRDGCIQAKNLEQNNLSHEWLYNQLAVKGVQKVEDVVLASLATDGSLYIDVRNDTLLYIQKTEDDDSLI